MTNLYFLIPEVNAKIFNPTAELAITIGKPTNEANAKIETQQLRTEQILKALQNFLCFSLIKSLRFTASKR